MQTRKSVINNINKDFYNKIADEFSVSRQYPWSGWEKLVPYFFHSKSVLDIGCGNGRLLAYLRSKDWSGEYLGIDNNERLLEIARSREISGEFLNLDFYKIEGLGAKFDCLCGFGITHHLADPLDWLKQASNLVTEGGYLILTFWEPPVSDTLVEPPTDLELLKGDKLLSWGNRKDITRFVHIFSDTEFGEIFNLFEAEDFEVVADFRSDGKTNNLNRYVVAKKLV